MGAATASLIGHPRDNPFVEAALAEEVPSDMDPERSPIDMRDYKAMTLENGLRVLMISDKDADRAAAALDVHAGYYADPDDLPGLAHFCEHTLFLGTEEFPDENSYDAFITESGGSSNAFTDGQDTVYYFTVGAAALPEALQRFSSFFKTPLFTPSATEREINAIDSEHQKNLQDDAFRGGQLLQSRANPKSPYRHFGTGTRATLLEEPRKRGRDLRTALLAYYERYYVAPLMTLCMVGSQPISELQAMVEQFFGPIRGLKGGRSALPQPLLLPSLALPPFLPPAFDKELQVVPVSDVLSMDILFPVRFQQKGAKSSEGITLQDYRFYSPAQHISNALGYEGRRSLCASLRKQGLATGLNAGMYDENEAFAVFSLQVELTSQGLERRDEVVEYIFGYINYIRNYKGWPRELLAENITLSEANWRCLERAPAGDTCVSLARSMHRFESPRRYISGPLRLNDGPGLESCIDTMLASLTASNALIVTNARGFETVAELQREKWYGTRFAERDVTGLKGKCDVAGLPSGLGFPPPNPFLPRSLELKAPRRGFRKAGEVDPPPEIRRNDEYWQLYFTQDVEFGVPKAYALVELLTPLPRRSAKAAVMCRLYEAILQDALTETLFYDAYQAGLTFNLSTSPRGVRFFFGGYDDRLLDFAKVALEATLAFDVTSDRGRALAQFDILERELRSFSSQAPWKQANYWATLCAQKPDYAIGDLIAAFKTITPEDILAFSRELWSSSPLFGLAYAQGNLLPGEADSLVTMVSEMLKFKPLPKPEWPQPEILQLPLTPYGMGAVSLHECMDAVEENSACQVLFQIGSARTSAGPAGNKLLAGCEVLGALLRDRFYADLRTQQQLGYIVFCLVNRKESIIQVSFTVQGTALEPLGVVKKIEAFIEAQRDYLQSLSQDAVAKVAGALADAKQSRPQQLAEAVDQRYREISSREFVWDRQSRESAALRQVTKEDVKSIYASYILEGGKKRRRFASLVYGAVHRQQYADAGKELQAMRNVQLVSEPKKFAALLPKWV